MFYTVSICNTADIFILVYIMDFVGFISSEGILGNIWSLVCVILVIAIVLHSDFDSVVLFLALSALCRKSDTMLNRSGKNEKLFPGPDHEGISVLSFTTEKKGFHRWPLLYWVSDLLYWLLRALFQLVESSEIWCRNISWWLELFTTI